MFSVLVAVYEYISPQTSNLFSVKYLKGKVQIINLKYVFKRIADKCSIDKEYPCGMLIIFQTSFQ